jgi:hypothetical protein
MHMKKGKLLKKLRDSPINYFSDLFIAAMVLTWIIASVLMIMAAIMVTAEGIILSFQTQTNCFDASIWSYVAEIVGVPLTAGGALWMIKNAVQHAIMNKQGKQCKTDFPPVDTGDEIGDIEQPIVEPAGAGESEVAG